MATLCMDLDGDSRKHVSLSLLGSVLIVVLYSTPAAFSSPDVCAIS